MISMSTGMSIVFFFTHAKPKEKSDRNVFEMVSYELSLSPETRKNQFSLPISHTHTYIYTLFMKYPHIINVDM